MSQSSSNRQWRLIAPIDVDQLIGTEHFELVETPIPDIRDGELLLRTMYLGTSPAQRGYVTKSSSMHAKVAAGDVMSGRAIAVVVQSKANDYKVGDIVNANTGWQDYSAHQANASGLAAITKISNSVKPYSLALGLLGTAGYTAYFGLTDVANAKAGDTVLISAAAGGVGSCAVQIAKAIGCNVVGITGGAEKCDWLQKELKLESVIDYNNDDLEQAIQQACPNGVDVFFDNVGGEQLNIVLKYLALNARIAICGYISTDYSKQKVGPENYTYLLRQRARMEGFFILDYQHRFAEAEQILIEWYQEGLFIDNSDIMVGLEHMPMALQSLFTGGNTGVRICQVANQEELL